MCKIKRMQLWGWTNALKNCVSFIVSPQLSSRGVCNYPLNGCAHSHWMFRGYDVNVGPCCWFVSDFNPPTLSHWKIIFDSKKNWRLFCKKNFGLYLLKNIQQKKWSINTSTLGLDLQGLLVCEPQIHWGFPNGKARKVPQNYDPDYVQVWTLNSIFWSLINQTEKPN